MIKLSSCGSSAIASTEVFCQTFQGKPHPTTYKHIIEEADIYACIAYGAEMSRGYVEIPLQRQA